METYRLTTEDVLDLRCSVRHPRIPDGTHGSLPAFLVWLPAERAWALHHYGYTMAVGRLEVVAACARIERSETGFIRRIMDSAEPPDVASLAPDERAAYAARTREEERRRASYAAEVAATAQRRASMIDVSKIELGDLLD